MKVQSASSGARYQLTIMFYPNDDARESACVLIYDIKDRNLLASMSDLPYTVGRSFSENELQHLGSKLQKLGLAFTFRGLTPGAEDVIFDPRRKLESNDTPPPPNFWVRWVSFGIGAMISATLIGFWLQSRSHPELFNESRPLHPFESRAVIESLNDRVEYRRSRDLVWQDARRDLPLDRNDAVRTFENSTARLRYREGTLVDIRPKTLMIIGETDAPSVRSIDLKDGVLSAEMHSARTRNRLSIKTESGVLELQSPPPGSSEKIKVDAKLSGTELKIAVREGTATLVPNNPSLKPMMLTGSQQLTATPQSISEPVPISDSEWSAEAAEASEALPKSGTITLLSPAEDQTIRFDPEKSSPILFRWKSIGENARYRFLIASDPHFQNILVEESTDQPQFEVEYLDFGKIFWRVQTSVRGQVYESETRMQNVEKYGN